MKKVLAIVGPTASGKTRLSVEVAKKLNGEIISADSRQVYKLIPISTSQPEPVDMKAVKHYFINELNPEEEFNAGEFGTRGRHIINDIFKRNKLPVIAGGSGLYIRSLIDGLFEEEIENSDIRKELYDKLNLHGEKYLYDELKKVDPVIYEKMPMGKIRRVIRALEVFYVTGKPISEFQKEKTEIDFETVQVGLMFERKHLYQRINNRVDEMIKSGLLDEAKYLRDKNYDYKKNYSLDTVGLKEIFKYFDGEYDYEEMIRLIKQNTRRYAKRQMTWFRKDKRINWINVSENSEEMGIVNEALRLFT